MTNFNLKIIGLLTMLLDHIWLFFPNSPYLFHILGRISAPIFIYCCVMGYTKTSSKKNYMMRLYLFSIFMCIFNIFLFDNLNKFYFNFPLTLFVITMCCLTIEVFKNEKLEQKCWVGLFWGIQVVFLVLIVSESIVFTNEVLAVLVFAMLGAPIALEGGVFFVFLGVIIYLFKDSKVKLASAIFLMTALYMVVYNTTLVYESASRITRYLPKSSRHLVDERLNALSNLFLGEIPAFLYGHFIYENPQWLMILAGPIFISDNGEKGKNSKWLFYIFYPAHLFVLSIWSRFF